MLTLLHSFNDLALFRPARLIGKGSETFQECSDDDNYVPLEERESFDNAEDAEDVEARERLIDSKIEEAKKKVKTEWIDMYAESRDPHHKEVARKLTEALKSEEEEYERILREELEAHNYDVEKLAEILFNNLFNTEIKDKDATTVQAPEPIEQSTPEKRTEEGEDDEALAFKAFRAEREAPRTVRNAMELCQDIIDFMLLGPEQDKKEMGRLLKATMEKRAEEYEAMLRRELEEHGYGAEELADLLMDKLLEGIPPGSLPPAFRE